MDKNTVIVDVRVESDLYVAGRTEDGEDYTAEVFIVCIEYASGLVFAHKSHFKGCRVEKWITEDDSGTAFVDIRTEQKAKAEHLARRVKQAIESGGFLDMTAYWYERRAAYGSTAYLQEVAEMTPRQRAGEPD